MLWASDQIDLRGTNRTSNSVQASFSFGAGSHVHQLLPLEKDDAWALFWMEELFQATMDVAHKIWTFSKEFFLKNVKAYV